MDLVVLPLPAVIRAHPRDPRENALGSGFPAIHAHRLILTGPAPPADIPPVSHESVREKFQAFLTEQGHRVTNQRLAIFDAAMAQTEHFTAEQLLDRARALDDSVSRATVYRTLPLMTESQVLREIDIGTGEKYYRPAIEGASSQVAQVVCVDCDKIFEISAPFMEWYGSTVSLKLGLKPVSQRLQVSAQCIAYRSSSRCPNRTKK
jgi:Fur family ferric uptake transcriptional regulator